MTYSLIERCSCGATFTMTGCAHMPTLAEAVTVFRREHRHTTNIFTHTDPAPQEDDS